jgi:glycosyltransferase involved in cell wall biosynthesis
MKIVHVVYSMEMGGAEMLVAQLSRLQRKKGNEVTVCAYSTLGVLGQKLRDEGIHVHVLGEAHPAKTVLRYLRLFHSMRPDVVHCHNPAPTLQAAFGARLSGAACVLATRHSLVSPPYDWAAEIKFNITALCLDWIVGICDITCRNLRGAPLARANRIVRVYNGTAAISPESSDLRDDGRFTLLFVGRVAAIKDLGTLLKAVAIAHQRNPRLRLWIVGDGPVRSSLESLSKDLNLSEVVTFWGQQMQTERFFSAADTIAMSSTSEGLPMSLLQGMSLGLPAVVTAVGGMQEIVDLSRGGLMSPVGDADAMAEAISRLMADRSLREELGNNAREAYGREFTLECMEEAYAKLYRSSRVPIAV